MTAASPGSRLPPTSPPAPRLSFSVVHTRNKYHPYYTFKFGKGTTSPELKFKAQTISLMHLSCFETSFKPKISMSVFSRDRLCCKDVHGIVKMLRAVKIQKSHTDTVPM